MLLIRFLLSVAWLLFCCWPKTHLPGQIVFGGGVRARPDRTSVRAIICRTGPIRPIPRRQLPAQQAEERLRPHRDQPRRVIAAVRYNPCQFFLPIGSKLRLVAFGLHTRIGEIQILNPLHFDMQPGERVADHVGGLRRAAELLPAPRIKPVLAQQ